MALPWNSLGYNMRTTWGGKEFWFDVAITDNTTGANGGRTDQKYWNDNSDLQWHNTSIFGKVNLISPVSDIQDTRLNQYISGFSSLPTIKVGSADVPLTAYSSSGLAVTFKSSNSNVATIVNDKIHAVAAGTCTITASQAGSATYKPASSLSLLLTVKVESINTDADLVISKVMTPPKIDANPYEWTGTWIKFGMQNPNSTTNDMTGKFQLAYDDNCLYIIEEIHDATPSNDTTIVNTYERDCSEIFIAMDMDTFGLGTIYHDGVWQIRKQRSPKDGGVDGNNGKVGGGDNWDITPLTTNAKFMAMSSGAINPYYIEMALPWNSLGHNLRKPWGGKEFWFDIVIADNSIGTNGGKTDQKFWHNNSYNQWHNTSTFGKVSLASAISGFLEERLNSRIKELEGIIDRGEYAIYDTVHINVLDMKEFSGIVKLSGGNVTVKIYPNPTNRLINLEVSDNIYQYEIFNIDGKLMKSAEVNAKSTSISISNFEAGTYILKIVTSKGAISNKLILTK